MLEGKVAVVTGAGLSGSGAGLGASYVRALAAAGAHVIGVDLTAESMSGLPCAALAADLTSSEQVSDLFKSIGRVDILVNNAGVAPNDAEDTKLKREFYKRLKQRSSSKPTLLQVTDANWQRFWAVNVHALFYCARAAFASMHEHGWGRIINVSSMAALSAHGGWSPGYAASKGAVISFTKAIAHEAALSGVLVNAIAPGGVETEEFAHLASEVKADILSQVPAGRLASYSDYASLVVYLAGEHYFVGQVLSPNGGIVI